MSEHQPHRERPRRLVGRLIVVLLVDALTLLFLSWILTDFQLDGFLAAIGMACLLGLADALIWPLLLRIALPFTVLTLGFGALILNAALLYGVAAAFSGVHIDSLFAALIVLFGLTAVTTFASGLLALDRGDLWLRTVVKRQIKRGGLQAEGQEPGVLFLEIDGLAHAILQRALRDGNAPALSKLLRAGSHRLEEWETHWSSQTGACQAGLLHGDDYDMPAFRWWEKDRGRAIVTNHPRDAAELERRHSNGRGLLHHDGASRANILSGDAPHSMLTMSTVPNRKREGRLGQDYFAYFASPFGTARTALRVLGEIFIERWQATQQVRRDVTPRIKRGWSYAVVRGYATVIQLDLQVASVTSDVLAGRPVVYTTFLAYDEVAHHSGLERPDTLAVLRRVDQAIDRIMQAIPFAPRPYRVVILSDHGQSQGATFLQRYNETLEDVVKRHAAPTEEVRVEQGGNDEGLGSLNAGLTELTHRESKLGRLSKKVLGKRTTQDGHVDVKGDDIEAEKDPKELPEISVMASGNLGLISFPREPGRVTLEQLNARRPGLLEELRNHDGVGFVLVRSEVDGPVVLGQDGRVLLSDMTVEGVDPLEIYGPNAGQHVLRTDGFEHCPDIVVQGRFWPELEEVAAFEELVGSHGGLGGGQAHPFVLFPSEFAWPDDIPIGAGSVHQIFRTWLAGLGHQSYEDLPGGEPAAPVDDPALGRVRA